MWLRVEPKKATQPGTCEGYDPPLNLLGTLNGKFPMGKFMGKPFRILWGRRGGEHGCG